MSNDHRYARALSGNKSFLFNQLESHPCPLNIAKAGVGCKEDVETTNVRLPAVLQELLPQQLQFCDAAACSPGQHCVPSFNVVEQMFGKISDQREIQLIGPLRMLMVDGEDFPCRIQRHDPCKSSDGRRARLHLAVHHGLNDLIHPCDVSSPAESRDRGIKGRTDVLVMRSRADLTRASVVPVGNKLLRHVVVDNSQCVFVRHREQLLVAEYFE
mmetsp:Transcript_17837/g.58652  ORF Transcript_17837/g.58652 Transcript_17837/m.58652 type:complete len:214 (-) Transcript_17837:1131-1772(-)